MSKTSRVPDHCITYALSDEKEKEFNLECDHAHGMRCDRCDLIPSIFDEVESTLNDLTSITAEDKKEMTYTVNQAKKNIQAWKAHLLRAINQDEARLDVLESLDDSSALVVLDWAMKFLPRKYRESQSDWCGKKGISWHIAVAMTKHEGILEMITLTHVFRSCNQF